MDENLKKKRGRPKGRPSGGSNITVIEDETLLPYKIYIDEDQYTVVDTKEGKAEKTHGFFTSLGNALKKITRMQLINNRKYTLPTYVLEYEKKLEEFSQKFKL